jgi:hypothetical protein
VQPTVIGGRRELPEQVAAEGREPDTLSGPQLEGMPLVLVEMAEVQHRIAQDSDVFSSSRSCDLRAVLADMADAQRMHPWTNSCPFSVQRGAIRCPVSADSDDWIASAMFDPGLPAEGSQSSGHRPRPVHDVNRVDSASDGGSDRKETPRDDD